MQRIRLSKENDKKIKELEDLRADLNSIIKHWSWEGDNRWYPETAQEFLNKFAPWVKRMIEMNEKECKFLESFGFASLDDVAMELQHYSTAEIIARRKGDKFI